MRHNVDAAGRPDPAGVRATDAYDTDYQEQLSDDAIPALAGALDELGQRERDATLRRIDCDPPEPSHRGWAAWNYARAQAERARTEVCRTAPSG